MNRLAHYLAILFAIVLSGITSDGATTRLGLGDSADWSNPNNWPPLGVSKNGDSLAWDNKLLVDGSMEVVAAAQSVVSALSLNGRTLVFAGTNGPPNASYAICTTTNAALPSSQWESLLTNSFDTNGRFEFTNAIAPSEAQLFFEFRTPYGNDSITFLLMFCRKPRTAR